MKTPAPQDLNQNRDRDVGEAPTEPSPSFQLKQRLQSLGLLIVGSLLLSGLLWLLFRSSQFLWPETWLRQWQAVQTRPLQENFALLKQSLEGHSGLPIYFIGIQILQVLFAPIPGQAAGLLGGWLFGFWGGLALTMLGLTLGSGLAMLLGRWGGRPLLKALLPESFLKRFDLMVEKSGAFSFFMLFLLPALPDDAICLLAGLTRLRLSQLLLMAVLGRLPGMAVLSWLGTELKTPDLSTQLLLLGVGGLSLGLWLYQDHIEEMFVRWLQRKRAES